MISTLYLTAGVTGKVLCLSSTVCDKAYHDLDSTFSAEVLITGGCIQGEGGILRTPSNNVHCSKTTYNGMGGILRGRGVISP